MVGGLAVGWVLEAQMQHGAMQVGVSSAVLQLTCNLHHL
jgi:hypothetical protein